MPALAAVLGLGLPVHAQQRPDAGTLQEAPRPFPPLPAPGGPRLTLPAPASSPPSVGSTEKINPVEFRFTGNASVTSSTLAALLAPRLGKPTDLAGLEDAARAIKEFYQDRGLVLTEAYLPEQSLDPAAAVVTISIIEARVGRVDVQAEGPETSQAVARTVVAAALPPGASASEDALDLPVLLLRDRPGYDATATVQPGAQQGEVDVTVHVRAEPRRFAFTVGADNHGVSTAGTTRAFVAMDGINLTGRGDVLSAWLQVAEITDTRLYRLAYTLPLAERGTRLALSLQRSEYALGRAFELLGARGYADIASGSVVHPFVRSRSRNVYALAGLEYKQLHDEVLALPDTDRHIALARLGVAGNFAQDDAASGGGIYTNYALTYARGDLRLDALSLAADQGFGGARAAGAFGKVNFELQHAHFLTDRWAVHFDTQLQWASRNLSSAEKIWLGGPTAVRAYPSGEASGDTGGVASLELHYRLPAGTAPLLEPLSFGPFFDFGHVRINQDPFPGLDNHRTLRGAGVLLHAGQSGKLVFNASLAWRLSDPPASGEPDRKPRAWVAVQKTF